MAQTMRLGLKLSQLRRGSPLQGRGGPSVCQGMAWVDLLAGSVHCLLPPLPLPGRLDCPSLQCDCLVRTPTNIDQLASICPASSYLYVPALRQSNHLMFPGLRLSAKPLAEYGGLFQGADGVINCVTALDLCNICQRPHTGFLPTLQAPAVSGCVGARDFAKPGTVLT